ncbi:stress protein [Dysgonomonas sp. 520]|uniref:stress protein n=1 Tax=Dysgonomonas sp. 520 TaxID=2302931 RepID=UPI0013D6F732|nr:stress protein [Dysgonomonas sp. 520]NDW10521.1 stress protein [Dysgonomonas sp. 520]
MAIDLNKITLEKQGDSHKIDLTKGDSDLSKEIVINLNWTQDTKEKKGFFSKLFSGNSEVDLDLGCFYELNDGQKSVIDGLQFARGQGGPKNRLTRQGYYTGAPWIWHTGDDRAGTGQGENILVNPQGMKDLKRIVVYCFIYEGVAKWDQTNAVATIKVSGNPDIVIEMGKQYSSQKFCALAEILFDQGNSLTVRKLVSFHNGHGDCDKAYSWGMKWSAGSK